jgi:hypothetical protein
MSALSPEKNVKVSGVPEGVHTATGRTFVIKGDDVVYNGAIPFLGT